MMRPYTEYQQSDISWLGKVPKHWTKNKFKFLLNEKPKTQNLELPCGSISFGHVVFKDSERLSEETKAAYQEVLSGEFLINPLNLNYDLKSLRTALADIDVIVSSGYIVLKSLGVVDKAYLRWLLYLFDVRHMKTLGAGIRQTISFKDIADCAVYIPNDSEQKAIATFLDRETLRIDSLIEEKQAFIKLLKEKRQALISHVVTKGLNPNVEMQDSGIEWIGQVPKHWVIRRLKHTSTLQSGIAKGKDNANKETLSVPMLRVANVQDGYVKLDDVHEINVLPHEVERYALKDGDVLMNEGGDNDKLGRGTVWKEQIKPCIHQNHVFVIRVTDIEPEWLGWLTQSSYAKFYFFRVSKQSTNLASISSTNVKEVHLLIPPADERKIIMEYLEKQTSKLKLLVQDVEESITLLKEHRTSLISAAVTGKIDVREAV
ncbi:restriction endonuclease subunit S [Vibrio parahaemolyticus]|uniref:restriction endonuclease subunit S n=1 Tax=Vibrio parahaemolyticus TaxID=670 RepID=UPI00111F6C98|nr:restriction endonuclease subunit S [Vibrio parahaemolyticus]EJE4173098.1 restriction endonuclease subunit S [Vibrio parahaemolyticus]MBO0169333.1 restriction endonuclease subunit S [Vibrio parahaemolyticus]MDF4781095.1 restriction endonuclease subunit S [Vibrio parahaemolyticus]MDF4785747.1 restriction endonuclease subunit S [Vibrio parahaemolyticus]MDF4824606.1 restriction endonuclease subunit S [Vibrio parahaemolyticus]